MHAKPDLRVFLKLKITGSGSVITDVIRLQMSLPRNQRNAIRECCRNCMASLGSPAKQKHADSSLDNLITAFSCPEQLDAFVQSWNWDGGNERLKQILEHPLCERATALRVYWLGSPQYYLQYRDRSEVRDYELDAWDFLRWIEERYADSQFVDGDIYYSPPSNTHENGGRVLPEIMYDLVGRTRSFWQILTGR